MLVNFLNYKLLMFAVMSYITGTCECSGSKREYEGKCYHITGQRKSRAEAELSCATHSGFLATLKTEAKLTFVIEWLNELSCRYPRLCTDFHYI